MGKGIRYSDEFKQEAVNQVAVHGYSVNDVLCRRVKERYRFIKSRSSRYPVRVLCRTLDIHPSGYYDWLKSPVSKREREDQQRGYNTPRGYYSGKPDIVAANELNREFNVERPNQLWVTDITYIKTHEGFLFLAVVMDLFARNIVGWSMSERMTEDLAMQATTAAYWRRKPQKQVNLHSDQGSQYSSRQFRKLLDAYDIKPSMGRRGNCHDNAVAESFFSNLKKENSRVRYRPVKMAHPTGVEPVTSASGG